MQGGNHDKLLAMLPLSVKEKYLSSFESKTVGKVTNCADDEPSSSKTEQKAKKQRIEV